MRERVAFTVPLQDPLGNPGDPPQAAARQGRMPGKLRALLRRAAEGRRAGRLLLAGGGKKRLRRRPDRAAWFGSILVQ